LIEKLKAPAGGRGLPAIPKILEIEMVSLNEARRVIRAAENKAIQLGCAVSIAVVDETGHVIAHVRMDDAWFAGAEAALAKAYTACAFNLSTAEVAECARPGGELWGVNSGGNKRITLASGGVPLRRHGRVLGAIGVSGCCASEDETIALAGARAFATGFEKEAGTHNFRQDSGLRNYSPSQISRFGLRGVEPRNQFSQPEFQHEFQSVQ
jgi:uncharacterized protein GlcG (DUF336 family)